VRIWASITPAPSPAPSPALTIAVSSSGFHTETVPLDIVPDEFHTSSNRSWFWNLTLKFLRRWSGTCCVRSVVLDDTTLCSSCICFGAILISWCTYAPPSPSPSFAAAVSSPVSRGSPNAFLKSSKVTRPSPSESICFTSEWICSGLISSPMYSIPPYSLEQDSKMSHTTLYTIHTSEQDSKMSHTTLYTIHYTHLGAG
jgi:hypothetical protein